MKVLQIITDTNIGGAGKVLLSYLKHRDTKNIDHGVIVPTGSLLIPELEATGVRIIPVDGLKDKSLDYGDIKKLTGILKAEKPEVVHCHGAMSGRIAATRLKIGVVHTRHSIFDQPDYKKKFPVKNILGAINNHYSDIIVAVSPAAKDNITEIGTNPQKVRVVYNGISKPIVCSDQEKQAIRKAYGLKPDDFVCAIIARLNEVKGHKYLLEAAKLLENRDSSVKIIIAGTGPEEDNLHKLAEELNLTNVIFAGFVTETYKLENIMDLQLNCSYGTEATSLSLLEGMALGVPAAVTDFGGNPYVIKDGINGVLFPKKDSKTIAEAILKIKNNPELSVKLSKNAPAIFEKHFTGEVMACELEKIYKEASHNSI